MFEVRKRRNNLVVAFEMCELIFHATARNVQKAHRNAFLAILKNLLQVLVMLFAFYIMINVLARGAAKIRGDFMLYLLSGIFLYMTHIKSISAVSGSEGASSPMMQHAPMNTVISITASALSTLYIQILSACLILGIYHVAVSNVSFYDAKGAFGMFLMAWFTGCSIGMVFLAAKPWAPNLVSVFSTVYQRANMLASGKMFLANTLPGFMLALFDWNPLFHSIDQARGFTFINYNPHYSSVIYPLTFGLVCLMIGMMGEFFTRKRVSQSWFAGK
jgi:ABC-type polysaccharide/polyol phosphate export permease